MTNLDVTANATLNGQTKEFTFDACSDDKDTILESLRELFAVSSMLEDEPELEDFTIELTDTGIIHDNYKTTLDEVFEYGEALAKIDDIDMLNAGIDCDIDLDNIEEAYNGQFKSNEDFAQETAESLGEIPKGNNWPHYCIDWEWAAKELMSDYSESNGYYFRNL